MKLLSKHTDGLSSEAVPGISDLRVATVLIFVILNLGVFFIRLVSVWHYGALFPTSGGEPTTIYAIWKGVHHLTVYTWPLSYPFSVSPYT